MSARLVVLPLTHPFPADSTFYCSPLPAINGKTIDLTERARDSHLLIYFFPGPDAGQFWPELSGCAQEACEFRDRMPQFARLGAEIYGISLSPIDRLRAFATRESLPFLLLSDYQRQACNVLAVPILQAPDGKTYATRTTLLIRRGGELVKRFDAVSADGHAASVLNVLKRMR